MRRRGLDRFTSENGDTGTDTREDVTGTVSRQQAMDLMDIEKWRKARRKTKCKMARPNYKLVVGTKKLYEKKIKQDGEVEKYKCRLVA